MAGTLPVLNTLWIGPRLGPVERACLRSALAQGHEVKLWCYDTPAGVPDGVRVCDANDVVAKDRIIYHRGGSPALFSNLFRYELQRQGRGVWIDADLYLLRPLDKSGENLFAFESADMIAIGVLRVAPDCPVLAPLIELFEEDAVPRWLPRIDRWAARFRRWRTGKTGLAQMPWGVAGPKAFTALAREFGTDRWALPPSVFYPVPYERASWIVDPAIDLDDVIFPDTVAIHLWNELIRGFKDQPAPPGSFLARLQREGA